jgi:hypothetical protein
MNLNHPNHPWNRLAAAARTAPEAHDTSAPYGFATRVAALALSQERKVASLFERFAVRAMCAAFLLAVLSAVVNYPVINNSPVGSDEDASEDEPVAVLVEVD